MTKRISSTFVVACLMVFAFLKECYASKDEYELIQMLLKDYDPAVRPVDNFKDIVMVNFSLALQQIIDLDEKNQLLTTSIYMTCAWKDVHMRWNSAEFGNITSVRLPAKKVWKPDILVYNSAVDTFDQMKHTNVIIHSDGKVEWLPPGIFKTTCDVDILYFPFDEQRCTMKFGAWTHHGYLVDLNVVEEADRSGYFESSEWDILSMNGVNNTVFYDCCPESPFTDATFTIHIRRKTIFYVFNLILPCLMVCSLTILIFVLPADSGERMTLGITVLLAMVVFLQIVADNLPPTGVIPLLGKYFACSVIMVTLSVVASVFSMNLHHTTSANSHGMPRWIELVLLIYLPKLLFMKMPKKEETQVGKTQYPSNGGEDVPLVRVGHRLGNWQNELHGNKDPATTLAMQLKHSEKQIAKMCGDLHDIVQRMREDEEDEEIATRWRFAARVLDRFCLIFFIVFFILSTFFTLGMVPGVLFAKDEYNSTD